MYIVMQMASGWWAVVGPGIADHEEAWRSEATARRIADMMTRAFVKGQESVLRSRAVG